MNDIQPIKERIERDIIGFCNEFLPGGKISGGRYICADINGGKGQSLSVVVTGKNAGGFRDFSSDDHGDLIKLLTLRFGDVRQAIAECKRFLNMSDASGIISKEVRYSSPDTRSYVDLVEDGKVYDYLINKRMLSQSVIESFRVKETPAGDGYVFVSYTSAESVKPCLAMYVKLARKNGKKESWLSKSGKPVLWGMHQIKKGHTYESILITEGQIDAMSYATAGIGIPCLSIPNGVNSSAWVDLCFDFLESVKTIYLSFDNEQVSIDALDRLIGRLGMHKCRIIKLTNKDANAALIAGEDLMKAVATASEVKPGKLKSAIELADRAWERVTHGRREDQGIPFMGWEGNESINFKLRERELTLYTGFPGHGKSAILYQLAAYLIGVHKKTVAIASLEEPSDTILSLIVFQLINEVLDDGTESSREKFVRAIDILRGKLYLYDYVGKAPMADVMKFANFCVRRHGADHFMLDSVACTDLDIEDNAKANEFMDKLTAEMNETKAHFHVVAHPRKGMSGDFKSIPGIDEIKGAAQFGNLAYNVVTMWKNTQVASILSTNPNAREDKSGRPLREAWGDGKIRISKQRVGGKTGEFPTWYDAFTYRIRRSYEDREQPYTQHENERRAEQWR